VPRRKTTPAPTSAHGSSARIQARGPDDERDDDFEEEDFSTESAGSATDFEVSGDEEVGELGVGEVADGSGTLRFRTNRRGRRYRRELGGGSTALAQWRDPRRKRFGVGSEAKEVVTRRARLAVDHSTIVPASLRV
jgi:hypothetical protein